MISCNDYMHIFRQLEQKRLSFYKNNNLKEIVRIIQEKFCETFPQPQRNFDLNTYLAFFLFHLLKFLGQRPAQTKLYSTFIKTIPLLGQLLT